MTQTNPTTTAQATVLTEEQLANIESTLDTYVQHLRKVDTEWARTMAMNVVRSHRALTEQMRVLRTELRQTLVPCGTCGTGDQPKYMVPVGDDWLCPQCAGSQIHTLRTRLSNYERKALVGTLGSEAEADRYLTFINQPSPEPPRPRRKEQP